MSETTNDAHTPEHERRQDERYIDGLVAALVTIREYGEGRGIIPCPQDYEFYIRPIREIAERALEGTSEE